jgi:hypothetical protein
VPRVDNGIGFEWRTEAELWGYPLVCVAVGRSDRGGMRVAKGWIAVGQFAVGAVAFAQLGAGLVFGLGQFLAAPVVVAQVALGLIFGLGQLATGYVAVGQVAFGYYALCQAGLGWHVWRQGYQDPQAVEFFARLAERLGLEFFRNIRPSKPEMP